MMFYFHKNNKFFVYAELVGTSLEAGVGRVTACSSQTDFLQLVQAFRDFLGLHLSSLHMQQLPTTATCPVESRQVRLIEVVDPEGIESLSSWPSTSCIADLTCNFDVTMEFFDLSSIFLPHSCRLNDFKNFLRLSLETNCGLCSM